MIVYSLSGSWMEQSLPLEGKVARREIAVTDEVDILCFHLISLASLDSFPSRGSLSKWKLRPVKLQFTAEM